MKFKIILKNGKTIKCDEVYEQANIMNIVRVNKARFWRKESTDVVIIKSEDISEIYIINASDEFIKDLTETFNSALDNGDNSENTESGCCNCSDSQNESFDPYKDTIPISEVMYS